MTSAPTREQGACMPPEAAQAEMILAQVESLPTLPAVAVRLIELTGSDTSSAREVIRVVESDPAIASRLLSLVNRAHRGVKVSTVDRAVVLLGFDAVRCLVLSMQVFEVFSQRSGGAGEGLDLPGFWKHSLAVGCCARLLAAEQARTRAGPRNGAAAAVGPEEAFLCGLLHDMGKAALQLCFPKSYERVVRTVEASRGSILDEERRVFGLDHTTVGRRLAAHWNLPAMIAECAWLHHHDPTSTPTRIDFPRHVHLVQLADRLARHMHLGYSGNYTLESYTAMAEALGFQPEAIERVSISLPDAIEERAELIGLDRLTTREVYQGALVQANAELGRISSGLIAQQRVLEQRSRCLEAVCGLGAGGEEEPTHEQIARAAVRGLALLYPGTKTAICVQSRVRGLSFAAISHDGQEPSCTAAPLEPADTAQLPDAADGWVDGARLPPHWQDRLTGVLGEPPRWYWPIGHGAGPVGVFCVSGDDLSPDPHAGADLLAAQTARWLAIAEAVTKSRLLHEELADINRRLLAAQAQVAQMRSLAMVGEMAAGAAHELNNPLAVISGRAQLLDREGMSEEVRKNAGLIREHAHRASELVTELMTFAKPPAPACDALEPAALLTRIRDRWLAQGELSAEQFELQVSDDLPRIWADEAQMQMLFDELIRNAIEAMSGMPQPRLVVNCQAHPTDEKIVIRVQDNGRGMTPEVLERAAAPFYSSRPAGRGRGRGLGLSRAVRYAEINGGRIQLSSRPGQGTQVLVELPRAASKQ